MRLLLILSAAAVLTGCTVERIGPPMTITRPLVVKPKDVAVFVEIAAVPGRFTVIEEIWVKDTGEESPSEMANQLRVMAGARGANGMIMAPNNRRDNGTRIDLGVYLTNPFEYYRATAIWVGDGEPPVKHLGPERRRDGS